MIGMVMFAVEVTLYFFIPIETSALFYYYWGAVGILVPRCFVEISMPTTSFRVAMLMGERSY